jgi:tRNA-Thr(GGU) m(6)t(6)A37 methyltransferase TsaA
MHFTRRDFVGRGLAAAGCGAAWAFGTASSPAQAASAAEQATKAPAQAASAPAGETSFQLVPVGRVEKKDDSVRLRIFEKYAAALKGLEGWSHAWVFYWFDKNDTPQKRAILQVHPRGDAKNPLTGVFACRSPVRPNLIALSLCEVVSVKDGIVTVDGLDAFDATPILDIKPYTPGPDRPKKDTRTPDWAGGK